MNRISGIKIGANSLHFLSCLSCPSCYFFSKITFLFILLFSTRASADLVVSGQVALQWSHTQAKLLGKKFTGFGSQLPQTHRNQRLKSPFGTNEFDIKTDIMLDYQNERSWAFMQLQFDNQAGIITAPSRNKNFLTGSGTVDNLFLLKAYTGYSVKDVDIELGRHLFLDVFDSQIQFNSVFDGVLFRFNRRGAIQCNLAAFVIDQTVNHFGYVGEADFLGIQGSKTDFKYSLISWDCQGANRYGKNDPKGARFLNSQAALIYHLTDHGTKLYGAILHNHKAIKAANAFYVGGSIGRILHKNDWAVDANYQWVEAYSIPEWDVSGIGRFNPTSTSIYNRRYGGFANYKGYMVTGYYALTENITLQLLYQKAKQLSKSIGGTFNAATWQSSIVFAF